MVFLSNWLFFSWILFHKKTIITKPEYYANDLSTEKQMSIIRPNITVGNDNHIPFEEEKEDILSKIKINKWKWNQLQLLENQNISIIDKLLMVKEMDKENIESIYTYNINNGGLWKDWE